jgi:hypothetical protein
MLFSSGSFRAGGTNKSITPWRLQTNSDATRLQTAPLSSSAFSGVVAKQRYLIPPLHTPGSRKSAAPPLYFIAIFAPPFLAGYSNFHHMKERWCKSNQSVIVIALSAGLLFAYCVARGAKATITNTASTTTYVNNEPLMRRHTNFYIVSHHLTNNNQL